MGESVNFLHNGWYGTVFWVCAEHRVYNTVFVIAGKSLHRMKAFSALPTAMLKRRLSEHGKLGGVTATTGDPS